MIINGIIAFLLIVNYIVVKKIVRNQEELLSDYQIALDNKNKIIKILMK